MIETDPKKFDDAAATVAKFKASVDDIVANSKDPLAMAVVWLDAEGSLHFAQSTPNATNNDLYTMAGRLLACANEFARAAERISEDDPGEEGPGEVVIKTPTL